MEEFGSATLCTYRTVKFWGITCITKIFSFAYTAQWQWYTVNMKYCCVQDCKTNNTTAGVSLHKFPKNENLRKLWILAARREEGWLPREYNFICSLHFPPSAVKPNRLLLKDAVPVAKPIY